MRDIKFRAWYKEDKQMIDWSNLSASAWNTYRGSERLSLIYDILVARRSDFDVMQFTGKQDCEGTDIYEGDIIEFDKDEWGGDDNIHVVKWNNENAQWSWGGGCTGDMEFRTVIGNIYENPELIQS